MLVDYCVAIDPPVEPIPSLTVDRERYQLRMKSDSGSIPSKME